MPIMSKQLEDDFKLCIDRVIESRYEDDKIHCCVMDLKSKILFAMATVHNSDYAKCIDDIMELFNSNNNLYRQALKRILEKHFA
jgi:ribonuclease HIII